MDKIYVAALNEEVVGLDYFHVLGVGKINATLKTIELINKFNHPPTCHTTFLIHFPSNNSI